jgi:phosphatidylinositol alpha-1,6-mannosyltransferase
VLRAVPDAALLLVGGGPYRTALERLRDETGVAGSVRITGTVPWEELPAHYDAGDVFAMPCRTRRAGLDVEGLGIVYLEASATGLPVIAGDSGGAPDAVLAGETGVVVDGHSVTAVAQSVIDLLSNPKDAAAMGEKGRSWIEQEWRWEVQARRFATLLRDC